MRIYQGHEKEAMIGIAIFFVIAVIIQVYDNWEQK